MKKIPLLSLLLLSACVTINVYFPAAASEKIADEIIEGIQKDAPAKPDANKQSSAPSPRDLAPWQISLYQALDRSIAVLISSAHAASDLAIDTPQIRAIRASMGARYPQLQGLYQQGLIAIGRDGLLVTRGAIRLQDRNRVTSLIAAENADRTKLYQAIAMANGHPEWANDIKASFAARWVEHAQRGWWYQNASGGWQQK